MPHSHILMTWFSWVWNFGPKWLFGSMIGINRLCSATFEQLKGFWAIFCSASNLEQLLPSFRARGGGGAGWASALPPPPPLLEILKSYWEKDVSSPPPPHPPIWVTIQLPNFQSSSEGPVLGNFWATNRYRTDPNYQKGLYLEGFC